MYLRRAYLLSNSALYHISLSRCNRKSKSHFPGTPEIAGGTTPSMAADAKLCGQMPLLTTTEGIIGFHALSMQSILGSLREGNIGSFTLAHPHYLLN